MIPNPFKRGSELRVRIGLGLGALALLSAGPAPALAAASETDQTALQERVAALFEASGDLRRAGAIDSLLGMVGALEAEAIAARDTTSLVALRTHRGRTLTRTSRFAEAEAALHEAVRTAEATGDSTRLLEPLYRMVLAIDGQGRPARVVPWMERLRTLSRALGDDAYEGRILVLIARRAMRDGNLAAAREDLVAARQIFAREEDLRSELPSTQLLLGIVHANRGDWDGARDWWQACADSSRAIGLTTMEAGALTNLGLLEMAIGDPAAASRASEAAYRTQRELGRLREAVHPGVASVLQLARLGRYDEALARADEILAITRDHDMVDLESMVLRVRSSVHGAREAYGPGLRDARAALAVARRHDAPEERVETAKVVARHLAAVDSAAAALAVLEAEALPRLDRVRVSQRAGTLAVRAGLLLELGRAVEAVDVIGAARALADSLGIAEERVPLAVLDVEAHTALGRIDRARSLVDEAIALWEERRLVTTDARWREVMGEWSPRLAEATVTVALHGDGDPGAAWERLQRLRTRTLLERMAGPTASDSTLDMSRVAAPATLESVRARLDARRWIEVLWGRESVWIWTIDPDAVRVRRLDDAEGLARRLERLRDLARGADGAEASEAARTVGARLGEELFADAVEGPAWLVPDGPLLRVPPSLLRPSAPTAVAPSAAALRETLHDRGTDERPRAMVLAGQTAEGGVRLGGVLAELDWLGDRLGARRETSLPDAQRLESVDVLHVAAHAAADDRTPWRSGILLDADGRSRWWRAESIAATASDLQLVVLSTCDSADGRAVAGEGMIGLTQAFLAAGARCVVATTWPVDDGAALGFTRAFYSALGEGLTVAEAVDAAARRLREDPATAHPRHWAAWAAYGDGGLRLPVRLHSAGLDPRLVGGAVLLLLGAATLVALRRDRPRV